MNEKHVKIAILFMSLSLHNMATIVDDTMAATVQKESHVGERLSVVEPETAAYRWSEEICAVAVEMMLHGVADSSSTQETSMEAISQFSCSSDGLGETAVFKVEDDCKTPDIITSRRDKSDVIIVITGPSCDSEELGSDDDSFNAAIFEPY